MAFATFSGPVRCGTVKDTPGQNCGLVVLSRSYNSGNLTGTVVGTTNTNTGIIIPQGSQIIDIFVDQIVAATGGTTTIAVGTSSADASLFTAVATTAGGRWPTAQLTAALVLAYQNAALNGDVTLWVQNVVATATLTAGQFVMTVVYMQRASNGAQFPASA
jgi:hypothetical protein